MKLNIPREWITRKAKEELESGSDCTAGAGLRFRLNRKRDWHLYFATFYRNDSGWRFTIWERVDFTTNENWYLFYISWRNHTFSIGNDTYKRGLGCDFCGGSSTQ